MKTTRTLAAFAATVVIGACSSQSPTAPGSQSGQSATGSAGGATGSGGGTTGSTTSGATGAGSASGNDVGGAGSNGMTGSAGDASASGAAGGSGVASGSGSGSGDTTGSGSGSGSSTDGMDGGPSTVISNPTNRARTVVPFDTGWLFHYGDASGAGGATFADSSWRTLSVPHDWSIEGPTPPSNPFSMSAPSTGRGAYAPSGIGWYRKHFTLPQTLSGDKVYIEFDGVMENSTVSVNGMQIGNHPYGYASFRYDITSAVKFGTSDNVVAVETDTSLQPAERYYTGAGIYRHARVLVTNPVHIDQYATYVTTPAPTTSSATVKVTTSVVNSGTSAQMVTVQGTVTDPKGTALSAVSAPAQSIPAGGSATFTFSVPVSNPQLWDPTSPSMYSLLTAAQVGGTTVDDDVTPFGIREILFNAGMTINGKSTKFRGVAIHQDYHALGAAAPQRAMQRRLAQLKGIGVNAIRTAHNPPSPEFLDMCDRMGFLVLDEFTDVWTAHKYTDTGDYATYFLKAASTPTGMPAVPGVSTGALWWQVDFTGWIMRDRNHPSVALYSVGNEIHESMSARTPYLTKMVSMAHTLDTTRKITEALLDPGTAGDVGGTTNSLLDVWGDNYDVPSCVSATPNAPTKSGVLTEIGPESTTWTTVTSTAGLTGMFIWTGVDYLGEQPTGWPTIGGGGTKNNALLDAMGLPTALGTTWQKIWGGTGSGNPGAGSSASKLVVKADHTTLTADVDDIVYVEAYVADGSGGVVSSATKPITFAISGPGTIVAVDSASMTQETFRGNVRNSFNGAAYALVQATGAGSITVTASSSGLTGGSATITATAGPFVPCSGSCD